MLTATATGAFADKNAGANKAVTVQNANLSGTDAANYVLTSTTGATEQLKAMDIMAVNPIARVVAPRFWGAAISLPLLVAMSRSTEDERSLIRHAIEHGEPDRLDDILAIEAANPRDVITSCSWDSPLRGVADGVTASPRVCADLLQRFAQVSDGRCDQGRIHPVAVVLAGSFFAPTLNTPAFASAAISTMSDSLPPSVQMLVAFSPR